LWIVGISRAARLAVNFLKAYIGWNLVTKKELSVYQGSDISPQGKIKNSQEQTLEALHQVRSIVKTLESAFFMTKFSTNEKIEAVMRYQKGSESLKTIAKSIGLHHSVFSNWIRQYEHHGEEAFNKDYTSYPTQFKLDVLNYMNEYGTSVRETAAIFNIASLSTILSWQRSLELHGMDAYNQRKRSDHP